MNNGTAGWSDLVDELDRWEEGRSVAPLWWRDDDAVEPTPQLDRLLQLARGLPLALALIPAAVHPELAAMLRDFPQVAVFQHGWRHVNHAACGKKSEFPLSRAAVAVAAELTAGRTRLAAVFGEQALPVLVPPWNRFAEEFVPLLPAAGIYALSSMARPRDTAPEGVAAIDVHVDLVAWREDRGFIGAERALGGILGRLRAARLGGATGIAATGVLTHHLVMDSPAAEFLDRLVELTRTHRAARWVCAQELLASR